MTAPAEERGQAYQPLIDVHTRIALYGRAAQELLAWRDMDVPTQTSRSHMLAQYLSLHVGETGRECDSTRGEWARGALVQGEGAQLGGLCPWPHHSHCPAEHGWLKREELGVALSRARSMRLHSQTVGQHMLAPMLAARQQHEAVRCACCAV